MENFYGIEALKLVVGFAIGFSGQMFDVLEDGKIEWQESIAFLPTIKQVPSLIKNIKEVPKELGDLNTNEATELVEFIKEKFDLKSDEVEQTIEEALDLILKIYVFASKVKERFEKKA